MSLGFVSYLAGSRTGMCIACLRSSRLEPQGGALCSGCRAALRRPPVRRCGLLPVLAAYAHQGPAGHLMRELKYRGSAAPIQVFAPAMAILVPPEAEVLVPVPRVLHRRFRYGIDPAVELARAVGRLSGLPVVTALRAPAFGRARAGRSRQERSKVAFRCVRTVERAVIVDDVVTTGLTIRVAASALGVERVTAGLAATSAA